jgi:carbonic anhydrase
MTQVQNLARTKAVRYALDRGQTLGVHGWVYSIHDGLIKDLHVTTSSRDAVDDIYQLHETKRGNRPHANFL